VKRIKDLSNPTRFGTNQQLDAADYETAENDNKISPRFSVSFPVSEKTQFRMSYGKFFQQPNLQDLYVSPDFLERQSIAPPFATTVGNPNLKAETSTQYEVGIRRALNEKVAIDINAYYKDIVDLINSRSITSSPNGLILSDNLDEGVVQGLNISLEVRRMSKFSGRLSYTLQSARGSGSGENSGFRAAWLGYSDAKFNAPLAYDQRHTINGALDIRNAKGEGPEVAGNRILENAGLNFIVSAGSGFPYTPTEVAKYAFAGVPSAKVTARRNSQNQPWTFRVDMKADKTFNIAGNMSVNVYVQVLNLLDKKNVLNIFTSTGRPDDDGFLAVGGSSLSTRELQQYDVLFHDGFNWDTPRQARLGVIFNF
jgi:outer membrane receptor protein involved in Fe transport